MTGKLTKQELKEPDKFQVMLAQGLTFFKENRKKFYIAGAVAAVLVLIASGWTLYSLHEENKARQIYARLYQSPAEDDAAAAAVCKEVISGHPRSDAATLCQYRLANLHYRKNDFDAAIQAYEAFLGKTPDSSDLKPLAYAGLGYCHEAKKDFKSALASFERAAGLKSGQVFEGINHQNLARVYEAMDDRAKALEHYRKALEKNADPSSQPLLKRKIATLS